MANITCPQCSRFVDDSARFCPGCKYNIKKYVKEMKRKGGTVSGSISFGSVYSKTSAGTDVVPELEFLKPAIPAADKPVPKTEVVEPVYDEPQTYEPQPAAPAYEEPVQAYEASEPPVVPTYEETAPAVSENKGMSTVDPRTLFPKDATPTFRPAYKPRVLVSAPAYDPNYKKREETAAAAAAAAAPAYEAPVAAAPAPVPAYEAPAAAAPAPVPAYEAPAAAAPAPVPAYEAPVAAAPVPSTPVIPVPAAPVAPAAPAYQPATPVSAAPAYQPATPVSAAPAYQPAAPAAAIPPEALLYQQPAAPASAIPAAAAAAAAIPPEALLYQQPAAPAYQPAAPAVQYQQSAYPQGGVAPAYQQTAVPVHATGNYQPARPIQTVSAPASYTQQRQQPAPAVTGVFESAALNSGVSGGGALSGEVSGPTILEKLRAEEEEKKANASIFESPNLRAAEKELKNGTRQPAGGLHGEISFDNYIAPERGSFGQATAYQIQQAAYVAAGAAGGGQSAVPPYAVQQGAGPGGMAYQVPTSNVTPAYAQPTAPAYAPAPTQAQSVPAFAAGPGMGNPYAPVNGAIPYITQTPAGNANPILGGGGNPILGTGNANPLLGGGT